MKLLSTSIKRGIALLLFTIGTIASAQAQGVFISGPYTVSCGSSPAYSALPSSFDDDVLSYSWTLRQNGITIDTSPSSVFYPNMPNSVGSVQVSVSLLVRDEFGNISTQYGSIWVTITSSTLSTPGFISGNYLTCNGATTRFSVAAVSGASSYQWTVPSGWTLAPGASNPSASPFIDLVAPATSYGSSTVRVRALSGSSCNNNSALRSRTVLYGKEVGTINGPSTLTAYQTNMFYGLNVNSSVTNVTWSVPNNGWYGYTDGDNYRLFVNNQSGILTAEYKSCNQNVRIEKYITVTTGGGGGLPIGFRGANPESELGLVDITLFPNPAVDYVEIQANAPIESVRVFTLEGREMLSESNVDANERISLKGLAKGIYLVQVNTATEQSVKQLVIE